MRGNSRERKRNWDKIGGKRRIGWRDTATEEPGRRWRKTMTMYVKEKGKVLVKGGMGDKLQWRQIE